MVELIIFDCDGVLVDSEPIATRVLAEALGELGLAFSQAEAEREFKGRSLASSVARMAELSGATVTEAFVADWQARTFAAFRQELRAVPGVEAALARLAAQGYTMCVASSSAPVRIELVLALTGLAGYFEGRMFSATQVAHSKPAPDLFLLAARTLGAAPARCVVVEDSRLGVEAAVAAGMRVLGYAPTGQEAFAAAGARTFADMKALPGLIEELAALP